MTEQVLFRQEIREDFPAVFELNRKAFGRDAEANLVNALRNNLLAFIPGLSIVATKGNKIIGHILLTKIAIKDTWVGYMKV